MNRGGDSGDGPVSGATSRGPGIVVIGRNEGERLRRCLDSVAGSGCPIVYVDSGSTDGSPELARGQGVQVILLATDSPFTAARARNEGWRALLASKAPNYSRPVRRRRLRGRPGLARAREREMRADTRCGAVFGRLRERNPESSIYNRLCDLEWDTPVGPAKYFGGNVMIRVAALLESGGFDQALIAGEDPELALRLRQRGWGLKRIAGDMMLHDAAMFRFGQWWLRSVRSGHAYAEGVALHGSSPERHFVHEARSNWAWGLGLPLVIAVLAWPTRGLSLLALLAYPALAFRIRSRTLRDGRSKSDALLFAVACVVGKFPGSSGN